MPADIETTKQHREQAGKSDPRTSQDIVDVLLARGDDDDSDERFPKIGILHARGTELELSLGAKLCASPAHNERSLGAGILGQLGWGDQTFLDETVDILIAMLNDPDAVVIGDAASALGHRNSPKAVAPAMALIAHPSSDVRFGVVQALSQHDDPTAISGLITLSQDNDLDVRNWATFGLAQMTTLDTPELRDALVSRTRDLDPEVRGEALIGLANRRCMRVLEPLEKELRGEFHGAWCLEASAVLGLPRLFPMLLDLKVRMTPEDAEAFANDMEEALAACEFAT